MRRNTIAFFMIGFILLAGCRARPASLAADPIPATSTTSLPAPPGPLINTTHTRTPSPTLLPQATDSPTSTPSPTITLTPSQTPTNSLTPTFEFPQVTVLMRAFCRYGPGKAYLYAHELKQGDQAEVNGRNAASTWLWIKPPGLTWHCWVAASVVAVSGELARLVVVQPSLPHSSLYGPPGNVRAVRSGDQVTVSWKRVRMTQDDDRGYLIEASLCQDGSLVQVAVQTNDISYQFTDQGGCTGTSGGRLYTVEKHGYTDPVVIPWP
jgi:hypothetical protein